MVASGSLPAFVAFPPASVRSKISATEWEQSLDAWTIMVEAVLSLEEGKTLESLVQKNDSGVSAFLVSYIAEHSDSSNAGLLSTPSSVELHKTIYLLVRKLLTSPSTSKELLDWKFLSQVCLVYETLPSLEQLLSKAWGLHSKRIETSLSNIKQSLIKDTDKKNSDVSTTLDLLSYLISPSSPSGQFFATGSDLLDGFISFFPTAGPPTQKSLVTFTYFLLISLVKGPKANHNLLSTHLYSLKSDAQKRGSPPSPSLLQHLASETDFLQKLKMHSSDSESDTPAGSASLPQDQSAGLMEFRVLKPKAGKGKKSHGNEPHFHKETSIFEIQDLFPDLGSGFIAKCLDFYKEDKEVVIAHLLDDSLPPGLVSADRTEVLDSSDGKPSKQHVVPSRKNIYDNDELDKLTVSAGNLHIGKSDRKYDEELEKPSSKAKILAALAAFDSDDDERDDTYDDVDDHVGASVDSTSGQASGTQKDATAAVDPELEKLLFAAWKAEPKDFTRGMRFTSKRKELKTKTGWTDEAIEGFGTMMGREPDREKKLERRFGDSIEWKGEQKSLQKTSWRDEGEDEDGDGEEGEGSNRGGARGGRGRGAGRGRGRGGAPSAVDSDRARKNKEVRGKHNRREGHAKKMARGGFAPAG
jgi:activating signal cointegrator complex subunit 2